MTYRLYHKLENRYITLEESKIIDQTDKSKYSIEKYTGYNDINNDLLFEQDNVIFDNITYVICFNDDINDYIIVSLSGTHILSDIANKVSLIK